VISRAQLLGQNLISNFFIELKNNWANNWPRIWCWPNFFAKKITDDTFALLCLRIFFVREKRRKMKKINK
jgi:hypothetical protein